MKIMICDDEINMMEDVVKQCEKFCTLHQIDAEVTSATNPNDVFSANPDILLLDIEMPIINGIEVKNQLELQHSDTIVIFITNCPDLVFEAFGKNVTGFLPKPLSYEVLEVQLEKALTHVLSSKVIVFKDNSRISTKNIHMIVSNERYTKAYTSIGERDYETSSLKEWMQDLEGMGFIRINDSCILNCRFIKGFEHKGSIILTNNNQKLNVSRRKRKECMEQYSVFSKKMAVFI